MAAAIRAAALDDAPAIGRLYAQSAQYLRALGDTTDFQFNAQVYARDGFGADAAFAGIVALDEEQVVGYLLYSFGYDTDRALRYLHVLDLLVDGARRGQGIGRALMGQAAAICQQHGGAELFWAVYRPNTPALEFYRRLGARPVDDVLFMTLPV